MVIIMVIAMAITEAIVLAIVPDTMQVDVPDTTGHHLILTDQSTPIMLIRIARRGLGKPEINNIIQGRATELLRRIDPDPLHNLPTGPIMCIRIAMGTYFRNLEMIGTGLTMVAAAPGRQGLQQGIPGHRRDSSPLQGIPGHRQDSSPHNRIVPPIVIPGRDHRVQATRPGTIIPGARGKQGHSNTNSPDLSIRAGLLNLPVRHRPPGQVAVALQEEEEEEDRYVLVLQALNFIF
jgi:hypothetical protein